MRLRWREADTDLRRRQVEILRELSARESPRVLVLFAVVIVAFDAGYALIGIVPPVSYYVSDAVQGAYMVVVAILILRRVVPPRWAPALFASAIVVNNLALNFQYTLVGYSAVGVILLLLASYGAVTLMWRPFLISAAIMAAVTTYTLVTTDPEQGPGWAVTAYTALAISGAILYGRTEAVIAQATANRTIEQLATRDALTGLLNRHGLRESGAVLTAVVDRTGQPMFAMFVDIAGLKRVNDSHGHLIGDLVIVRTAQALASQCREGDLLCRWGGDEFVILGLSAPPDADEFAARVSTAIDMTGLEGQWTPAVHAGSAVGRGESVEALIESADRVMYLNRQDTQPAAER
jgi:diguanylate cyclase (GGDEF)-like protein